MLNTFIVKLIVSNYLVRERESRRAGERESGRAGERESGREGGC